MLLPPCYPARPVNGGPLDKALPKSGEWYLEGKYNGWRAWVHNPTGAMFNRKLEPLSIGTEFAEATATLRTLPWEWSDVEALERRHALGRGSLILLDYLPECDARVVAGNAVQFQTYKERRTLMLTCATLLGLEVHRELNRPIEPHRVYLPMTWVLRGGLVRVGDFCADATAKEADWRGLWDILPACNRALGCEFWEGVVAKRTDSVYPRQRRSPDVEFPFWMKHRWAF